MARDKRCFIRRTWSFYLRHAWMPPLVFAALFMCMVMLIPLSNHYYSRSQLCGRLFDSLVLLVVAGWLGLLIAAGATIHGLISKPRQCDRSSGSAVSFSTISRVMSALFLVVCFLFGGVFLVMSSRAFSPEDGFVDDLRIPAGLAVSEPLDDIAAFDAEKTAQPSGPLLCIARSRMAGGDYVYKFRGDAGEAGAVYLCAYEVTKGTRLSERSLREGTEMHSGGLFDGGREFRIYEGDTGYEYAARFEVWFIPDSGGPERKLSERVYKIMGCMP